MISADDVPSQGRIGRWLPDTGDEVFVFVFPEIRGQWGFYTSDGGDDILPDWEYLTNRISEGEFTWIDDRDDRIVEKSIFAMRPISGSQYDPPPTVASRISSALRRFGLGH